MGLLERLVQGRENGIRARLRRLIFGLESDASPVKEEQDWNIFTRDTEDMKAPAPTPPADLGVAAPEGFSPALRAAELAPGQVQRLEIGGAEVALANVEGAFYAFNNSCPHLGGSLGDGTLDGHQVMCPLHSWLFDVRDGTCVDDADFCTPVYETQVLDGAVFVKLS